MAHICHDDGCYVLVLHHPATLGAPEKYSNQTHWFNEAVEVLKELPNPNDYKSQLLNKIRSWEFCFDIESL
ncbi:hypothetical protein [Scytonema sp. NUACC26]|uniref:hypothetical protein n=1 Tax=Scytonema sp. NUACC26 TaxID=3140176 RepID=UPI0038B2780D